MTNKRDKLAALRLMRKLLRKHGFADDYRHRSISRLRRCFHRNWAARRSCHEQASQQSDRKFARSGSTTRAKAARIQDGAICTTFLLNACGDLQFVQRQPPPHDGQHAPLATGDRDGRMAFGNRERRLNLRKAITTRSGCSANLTSPCGVL